MKTIVVSAVNLNTGGTLSILRECLAYLSELTLAGNYRVVALVYKKELAFFKGIEYIELKWPKKNWLYRLWCEYVTMDRISMELSPVDLWISLHDTTPTVKAKKRVVYCHNPFPFYKWNMRELLLAPKIVLFSLFSKYAYWKGIHKNSYVVVQQSWIKKEFIRLFNLDSDKIIVAPPSINSIDVKTVRSRSVHDGKYRFFFAAAANSHKNFECICRACELLEKTVGDGRFEVCITLHGNENRYVRWLFLTWGCRLSSLRFVGYLDKEDLYKYYAGSNCLIFPSKAETWGLPITEFAAFRKPMLLADLPYAHETASGCSDVAFFNPYSHEELAQKMKCAMEGNEQCFSRTSRHVCTPPVAFSWKELFDLIME